jgi:predicted small secreted protein
MKTRELLSFIVVFVWLVTAGCTGDLTGIGLDIQPDVDKIAVHADTFQIEASTVRVDSLLAKTVNGYLGEYYDQLYGRLKSDYLCQFYCQEGFSFNRVPYEGRIDSIIFHIQYVTWDGASDAPMRMDLYPITVPLSKNYYNDIVASDYADISRSLGSQTVTALGGEIIDSVLPSSTATTYLYYRMQSVRMPVELGQRFYDETINNASTFASQESFNSFFPGLYVTTGYGSGTLFHIERTWMNIYYNYVEEASDGTDSLVSRSELFMVSKDVIQLNRFESPDTEELLRPSDAYTYIKTPAGIMTKLVIPTRAIADSVGDWVINSLILNVQYLPGEEWLYALAPPPHLLLLPEDSLVSFFEDRLVENGITTYISTPPSTSSSTWSPYTTYLGYNATYRMYSFQDISSLIRYHIAVSPEVDLRLLLVPVLRTYQTQTSGYSTTYYYTTSLDHYLAPSGVKIRKDGDFMRVAVMSSKYPE